MSFIWRLFLDVYLANWELDSDFLRFDLNPESYSSPDMLRLVEESVCAAITLDKQVNAQFCFLFFEVLTVLRIRDDYPESRIRIFSIPDPNFFYPGSRIWIFSISDPNQRILSILTQKIVSELSEIWSGLFVPDPDPDFLPIPDPGSRDKKAPGPGSRISDLGSRIRIRNTGSWNVLSHFPLSQMCSLPAVEEHISKGLEKTTINHYFLLCTRSVHPSPVSLWYTEKKDWERSKKLLLGDGGEDSINSKEVWISSVIFSLRPLHLSSSWFSTQVHTTKLDFLFICYPLIWKSYWWN